MTFLELYDSGLSITPIVPGTKKPYLEGWQKKNGGEIPRADIERLIKEGAAFGVVCGEPNEGLECIDFDAKVKEGVYEEWRTKIPTALLERLVVDKTQNNGYHVFYRSPVIEGNLKLAYGLNGTEAFVETRGIGGQALIPPSPGYETVQGSLLTIYTITAEERNLLIDAARSFDETVLFGAEIQNTAINAEVSSRPGDDFNLRGTWKEILEPHGWRYLRQDSRGVQHWMRPGKKEVSTSATVTHDFLVVFSSSTPFETWDFAQKKGAYSKFSAYALLNHGRDYKAAAADLRAKGFGKEEEKKEKKEKETALEAIVRDFVQLDQMPEPEPLTWIWENFIAKESATLIGARGKGGKTTIITHLIRAMADDKPEFLGRKIIPTKTLILSEEGGNRWWRRNSLLKNSFGHLVTVNQKRPEKKPSKQEWESYCQGLAQYCVDNGYGLIVFDTLSKLFPIIDENANAELDTVLTPLYSFSNRKIACVVIHHSNKYGQGYQSTRGATAIPNFFDILVRLDIHGDEESSNIRKIVVEGRDEVERDSFLAELVDKGTTDERYVHQGKVQQNESERCQEAIYAILQLDREDDGGGLTATEIRSRMWENKPTLAALYSAIRNLEKGGQIVKLGMKGKYKKGAVYGLPEPEEIV